MLSIKILTLYGQAAKQKGKWEFSNKKVIEGKKSINAVVVDLVSISSKINSITQNTVFTLTDENGQTPTNFKINENGKLIIAEVLDRETKASYTLTIGAKNKNGDVIEEPKSVRVICSTV